MKRRDPVEIVAIAAPVIAEAVAVILFIMMGAVWILIAAGRV